MYVVPLLTAAAFAWLQFAQSRFKSVTSDEIPCRYVVPLLTAAAFTGALSRLLSMRKYSAWVTPASGVLLLAGGTYGLLSRTVLT